MMMNSSVLNHNPFEYILRKSNRTRDDKNGGRFRERN